MVKIKVIGTLFLLLFNTIDSHAKSITDDLIVALVESHLPQVLYTEKDKAWQLGIYDLTVEKKGKAVFSSTHRFLSLTVPIKVKINAQVDQAFLGKRVKVNCTSTILSESRFDVEPLIEPQNSRANIEISVPVPQSFLDCEGLRVNITPLLQGIVAKEKQKWQQKFEQELLRLLKNVGL
ncbi:DUF4403 family protein [Paraglaciecola sp.]|uniref:DUF4403 family protein n=1 Tax=Paraglaciecola sp. TaxID=1920173 RepID=UPI003EF40539